MRANRVIVMSREKAITTSRFLDAPTIIVSISDLGADYPEFADSPWLEDVAFLSFDDVESEEEGGMTPEDAQEIVDFVSEYAERPVDIIVHCGAGRSRSAGTAAALMLMLYGDDGDIFSSPFYSPNMHCYRSILNAAHIGYDEELVDTKEHRQAQLWTRLARENGLI